MFYRFLIALLFTGILSCKKEHNTVTGTEMYFPPVNNTEWATTSPSLLGWNQSKLDDLRNYLQQKNTKAFIILKNGKIVVEYYFGSFTADSNWYWASAGKTLTAMIVGIAQQENLLNINNRTVQYLGNGWTNLTAAKENLITVKHQLNMTSGLEDGGADPDCTLPSCLTYKSDAGSRWAYHNAPYTLLEKVVESATGQTYNAYFQQKIRNVIGMNGLWIKTGFNNVYYSNPRSMARYGLLLLNRGKWEQTTVLSDQLYFNQSTNSSQSLNPSYGYLTWLNGKANYMLPQTQFMFNGSLVPNAPTDLFAALGKNDQKIYVIPSQQLVVIRMGESAGNVQLAASSFDNELWGKIRTVIGY